MKDKFVICYIITWNTAQHQTQDNKTPQNVTCRVVGNLLYQIVEQGYHVLNNPFLHNQTHGGKRALIIHTKITTRKN